MSAKPSPKADTENRTLISLFAGAGGLDIGLERAGFKTVVANEILPEACESLRLNKRLSCADEAQQAEFIAEVVEQRCYKGMSVKERKRHFSRLEGKKEPVLQSAEILERDIRQISSQEFASYFPNGSRPFAIAGGPPCQPFSRAGKMKTLDCVKNGDLFYEFVRLVSDLKPDWFILENVKGLTFAKTELLYLRCSACGSKSLAPFTTRQLWAQGADFVNQCPACKSDDVESFSEVERGGSLSIILNEFKAVGYKCYSKVLHAADFGVPQTRERLFVVGSRDGRPFEWPTPTHSSFVRDPQSPEFDFDSKPAWPSIREVLWPSGHPVYGHLTAEAVLWVKNVVRPHDEPVTWTLDRSSPTVGAHQGAKFAIAPFGVPPEQLARQQWHTLGRRQGDTAPVEVEHEYLTDEELLKLQSFPSWWYLHGTRMQRAFQIGNAVPPMLAEVVGKAVIRAEQKSINNDSSSIRRGTKEPSTKVSSC